MKQTGKSVEGGGRYVNEHGRSFNILPDGSIRFKDVSKLLMGKECEYGTRFIAGEPDGYPILGAGLSITNLDPSNNHEIGIHPDDVEEFIYRFYAWDACQSGWVFDNRGQLVELEPQDCQLLKDYLDAAGCLPGPSDEL